MAAAILSSLSPTTINISGLILSTVCVNPITRAPTALDLWTSLSVENKESILFYLESSDSIFYSEAKIMR